MSWYAIAWSESAPVGDAYERAVVSQMARRAKKDGSDAALSYASMARYAVASERTIMRAIARLEERGVIAEGDQAVVSYIEPRYRPRVWNLQIPHEYFSADMLEEVNQERRELGRPPLTPAERPPLAKPEPTRAPRADVGTKKPRKNAAEQTADSVDDLPEQDPEPDGCLEDTPEAGLLVTPESGSGVTSSQAQGRLEDTGTGDYQSPEKTQLIEKKQEEKRGGYVQGDVAGDASPADDAPPPPKPLRGKPETWLCDKHLVNPDPDRKPCVPCQRVRERCEQREAELAAAARAEIERVERECTWHDAAKHVVDPATGLPFNPVVKCDCANTSPAAVAALLAAARSAAEPSGPIAEAGRAEYRRLFPPRPATQPRAGHRRGAAVSTGKSGSEEPVPLDVDHKVAV
jgi:hypothetical protein